MKRTITSERGQAIIVIALAAIALFAMGGIAIDGSAKFSDRRHAQNAADTAALAGALSLAEGNSVDVWKTAALNRAMDNGYDGNLATNTVEVYRCDEGTSSCGHYDGDPKYVQVIINSYINTYFTRVIGINQTHNRVQAVTRAKPLSGLYDGNLIVALNPDPCSGGGADGNITLGTAGGGSDPVINLTGGGLRVNSGGSGCGINLIGCPTITIDDGEVGSSGNGNINLENSSEACLDKLTVPSPTFDLPPYPFPPEMLEEPDECISPAGWWQNIGSVSHLHPGSYNEFPPRSTPAQPRHDTIFLEPGTYCVSDTIKLVTESLTITGVDVTIFIRDGYRFSFEGGTVNLTAPTTSDYDFPGYAIIVDSDFSGSPANCKIDGNGVNTITGTIFAPYCNLTINGTSGTTSFSSQILAYTVKLTGGASINLNYDEDANAKDPAEVGLVK